MTLGEDLVGQIDWSGFSAHGQSAADVGSRLKQLLEAAGPAESRQAFQGLENVVFAQDNVYGVAEPVVDVALAALATERPAHVQLAILDLLFLVVHGGSVKDPGLPGRIRSRAQRGVWLLARVALESPRARAAVVEVLGLLDEDVARLVGIRD